MDILTRLDPLQQVLCNPVCLLSIRDGDANDQGNCQLDGNLQVHSCLRMGRRYRDVTGILDTNVLVIGLNTFNFLSCLLCNGVPTWSARET
jgi:hypothetical protein